MLWMHTIMEFVNFSLRGAGIVGGKLMRTDSAETSRDQYVFDEDDLIRIHEKEYANAKIFYVAKLNM